MNGLLKILRREDETEFAMNIITPFDSFRGLSLHSNSRFYSQFAKVISADAIVCYFTVEDFEDLIIRIPSLGLSFSKNLNEKILRMERKNFHLIAKDTKSRLLDFFKDLARNSGKIENDIFTIKANLTHQDIADIVGCQRPTVSMLLKELEMDNEITYSRGIFSTNPH